ncbi:hypothetical protein [Thalassospira tepidiphila]|uniref:Uncharacterized protein n=1 Tax=Thalassospira tepidiphila TaxID=393657 RepID=A0ABX0X692_9PROT|nr:hypothetical protein [Thalassospira tepidiphila]NJB76993.1 hypothetical protein [Thalassospira tepidiphila]
MKADPEKVADALSDWVGEEIKNTTKRYHDLGRYMFTVSTGTVAFIVSVNSVINPGDKGFTAAKLSFFWLGISLIFSVYILLPKEWRLDGSIDLEDKLHELVKDYRLILLCWFGFWVVGLALGLFDLAVLL